MDAVIVTGAAGALGHAVVEEFLAGGRAVVALDRPRSGSTRSASGRTSTRSPSTWPRATPSRRRSRRSTRCRSRRTRSSGSRAGSPRASWPTPPRTSSPASSRPTSAPRSGRRRPWPRASPPGGAIVMVGSKTAVTGPAPVVHATSKAAVVRLVQILADELRPQHIRVNAVLPSVIDTPANRSWMSDGPRRPRGRPGRDRQGHRVPLRARRGPDQRRGDPGVRRCLTSGWRSARCWTGRSTTSPPPSSPTDGTADRRRDRAGVPPRLGDEAAHRLRHAHRGGGGRGRLGHPAGPPGSTVRHLAAHASGLSFAEGKVQAKPGTRRIYSNVGFDALGEAVAEARACRSPTTCTRPSASRWA